MHLNEIRLSDQLLQALYANTLVESEYTPNSKMPAQNKEQEVRVESPIQFLGKNNSQFVILVYYPDQLHLPDESFQFLGAVLKACQLNAADVAIVNLAMQSIKIEQLQEQLSPKIILGFGPGAVMAGMPVTNEFIPVEAGKYQYMQAPALEELTRPGEGSKSLKKQLWEGLKQMLHL
ncbi:hypothetical protein [Flavihumibacter profundi]|uniref:hypothetical protein n=1 Tax=Flavihumibacter profundi TaxID=2716883 RepID=UPI001CC5DC63|nr:hypothetical protein [Flavihumibacter profundi]MBZ5855663.1 hypothetical protein [Flavihumibacter profundi]